MHIGQISLFSLFSLNLPHFINIRPHSCRFINSLSDLWSECWQASKRVAINMDTTCFVCSENFYFWSLDGLDLLNISWSIVSLCVYQLGIWIFHGDFIISCLWEIWKTWTWHFIMSIYMLHLCALHLFCILCNFHGNGFVYIYHD